MQYQNGIDFHFDWSASHFLSKQLFCRHGLSADNGSERYRHWPKGQSTSRIARDNPSSNIPGCPTVSIQRHVHIPNLDHAGGDGFCRCARGAADCDSGPCAELGDARSGLGLYGRREHQGIGSPAWRLNAIASLVNVLATSSSVADSDERSETGPAIPLFKAALQEMPQMDSIYAAFENGAWLQVRRTSDLNEDQRARIRAPASADMVINLVRPTPAGDLPMRRIFRIGKATRSAKSISGSTDTTPGRVPGTRRR